MTLIRYVRKVLNLPMLWLRRRLWRIHPKRWFADLDSIPIDRPIFLLGVQGGGLTLIGRMLRRHPHVVSVTGNNSYWAGPDEMQNVLGPMLPPMLTGLQYKIPSHPQCPNRDWLYATDDLLPLYRGTREAATAQMAAEHWANSFHCALRDFAEVGNWHTARFEDVLRDPRAHLRELCDFAGLPFHSSMLPASEDTFPLGATGSSSGDNKWYPLRPDVNIKYLTCLQPWMVDILKERVAALAHEWQYTPEGP